MNQKINRITNQEDYNKIYSSILNWPVWQRAYANEHLLISKSSKKLPVYVDDSKLSRVKSISK